MVREGNTIRLAQSDCDWGYHWHERDPEDPEVWVCRGCGETAPEDVEWVYEEVDTVRADKQHTEPGEAT